MPAFIKVNLIQKIIVTTNSIDSEIVITIIKQGDFFLLNFNVIKMIITVFIAKFTVLIIIVSIKEKVNPFVRIKMDQSITITAVIIIVIVAFVN